MSSRKDQHDKDLHVAGATAAAAKKAAAEATEQLEMIHEAIQKAQVELESLQKCAAHGICSIWLEKRHGDWVPVKFLVLWLG